MADATIFSAAISNGRICVVLSDGRELSTPIDWYPTLAGASLADLEKLEISPRGLHWIDLDEDVGLDGMLAGRKSSHPTVRRFINTVLILSDFREQRSISILADASIDYPEQQEIISRSINE